MKRSVWALSIAFCTLLAAFGVEGSWARKPAKTPSAVAPASTGIKQVYNNLLVEQARIGEQISDLSLQLHSASAGKAKKINKQINLLNDELAAVERRLAAFPVSFSGAAVPNNSTEGKNDPFRKQLDSVAAVRVAASNPFEGRLSNDPELDRMYRAYLKMYGDGVTVTEEVAVAVGRPAATASRATAVQEPASKDLVYRVMVAISKSRLPLSEFSGLSDVLEQAMPAGGYAYYAGQYTSLGQAEAACERILAGYKFRDAFVVAMEGSRRVPIKR